MNGRNRYLSRGIGSDTLDGKAQNGTGLLVGFSLHARLGIADDRGRLVRDFVLQRIEKLGLCLLGRHASNALQTAHDLGGCLVKLVRALVQLTLHARDLMLVRIKPFAAAVKRLLALSKAVLGCTHFLHAFIVLSLDFLLKFESFVFCLKNGFALHGFGAVLGIRNGGLGLRFCLRQQVFSFLRRALRRRIGNEAHDQKANEGADNDADNTPDSFHGHTVLLLPHATVRTH